MGFIEQSVEVLDQGGFSRAGVSDDPKVFAAVGGEVHIRPGPRCSKGVGHACKYGLSFSV